MQVEKKPFMELLVLRAVESRLAADSARVAALTKALREVEWKGTPRVGSLAYRCPSCRGDRPNHAKNCKLAAALATTEEVEG